VVILIFGPPGSGKGTQSRRLSEWLAIPALSTGELLRAEVEAETELGAGIRAILAAGEYVSDDLVNRLVEKRLTGSGLILDGYPRTLQQARFLEAALRDRGLPPPAVIRLDVPAEVLTARLSARRQCRSCGEIYHLVQKPPRLAGACDLCQGALIQRQDDAAEVIGKRIAAYHELTGPVLEHYAATTHRSDGTGAPETVSERIRAAVGDSGLAPLASRGPTGWVKTPDLVKTPTPKGSGALTND
jgi:adenylate kinase